MILLLLLAYPLLVLNILGRPGRFRLTSSQKNDPFLAWLCAAIAMGLIVAVGSELLSLLNQLNWLGVSILWAGLDGLLLLSLRGGVLPIGLSHISSNLGSWRNWDRMDLLIAGGITAVLALLGITAVVAPPNNVDSLLYHMSRVSHWLQQGSLDHYAASYHHQLWSPLFAEEAILHSMALLGSDNLANFVQWQALVGSAVAIAAIAGEFELPRRIRLLAILAGLSAPMALLQATNSKNGLVVSFWALVAFLLLLKLVKRGLTPVGWLALAGAAGLGILTKVTFYPYLGLVIIAAALLAWGRGYPVGKLVLGGLLAALVIIVINAGFWLRNYATYGHPLGSPDYIGGKLEAGFSPGAPLADGIQHAAQNFATPSEPLNRQLEAIVQRVSSSLGSPAGDFQLVWAWNHEDLAGSPLHMILALAAILLGLIKPGKNQRLPRWYAVALLLAFVPFSWVVDYGIYRVRYHLTFLLLAAPLIGWALGRWLPDRAQMVFGIGLILLCLPWVFLNQSRPLISWQPRTRTQSILQIPRREALFANVPELRQPYTEAAGLVKDSACTQIGLSLDSSEPEYALWWLLDAPDPALRLEVVRPLRSLEQFRAQDFSPCAVICTNCGGRSQFEGLTLAHNSNGVAVYLK